jgi:hypothetical protein
MSAMKSLISRALGGAVLTAALLTVPATATASESARTWPFRLVVPGAVATGAYEPARLTVTVEVIGRRTCGVLQLATGGEWHTVAALCQPGTASIRTGAASRSSIRLCNGDSIALAEGVDCEKYTPGGKAGVTAAG